MKRKSVHEPEANVMSAQEVWDDAQQVAQVLQQNILKAEPVIHVDIPLSSFLSAIDRLSRDELVILHQRVDERLAV